MRNVIPLGDHCCGALLLKELGIRRYSYPFDWTVHIDAINASSIPVIIDYLKNILESGTIESLLHHYLPLPPQIHQLGLGVCC